MMDLFDDYVNRGEISWNLFDLVEGSDRKFLIVLLSSRNVLRGLMIINVVVYMNFYVYCM